MLLVCHVILVVLCVLNSVHQKDKLQDLAWMGMALCWAVMCATEIAELI